MKVLDRHDLLPVLEEQDSVILELGCGERKKRPGSIGIDRRDLPAVDLVGDVFDVLHAFHDATVAEVFSSHFMEHVEDLPRLLGELARVLKPGGRLEIVVPHFSNPYYYSDPTHRVFFGLYTLSYYVIDPLHRRTVPSYDGRLPLRLCRAELVFRSPKAFPVRRLLKRGIGFWVNLNAWTREFYEENLTALLPCYELRFELIREDGVGGET